MKEFGVSRKKVMVTLWWLRLSQSRTIWFCIPRINNPRAAVLLPLLPNLKETKLWKTTQQWPIWEELCYWFACGILIFLLRFAHSCTQAPSTHHRLAGTMVAAWSPLLCTLPLLGAAAGRATAGSSASRNGNRKGCALPWYMGITSFAH